MRIRTKLPQLGIIALALWIWVVPPTSALQEDEILIPPESHQKAIEALRTLGPERGALKLDFKVLTIEGIIQGLSAQSEKIQAALDDLGARETETEYLIELPGDILFDFDKWSIREDARGSLEKVAGIIHATQYPVSIIGHTDSKGADDYNLELSQKRAEAVKQWLVNESGLDSNQIETSGKGESEAVAPNIHPDGTDNPDGRQKNRRVEIKIHKE